VFGWPFHNRERAPLNQRVISIFRYRGRKKFSSLGPKTCIYFSHTPTTSRWNVAKSFGAAHVSLDNII